MTKDKQQIKKVVKHTYFSNWADLFGYPLAWSLVPIVSKLNFATPNFITVTAFFMYAFGSFSLFLDYPYHLIVASFLIFAGYIGDDLDGQIARYRNLSSNVGDFLDKSLDVLKIFIISNSLGLAVFLQTQNYLYLILGSTAAYMFAWRYYIKLETMFSRISKDPVYLKNSSEVRDSLELEIDNLYEKPNKSLAEQLMVLVHKNRTFLLVDEAEFVVITSIGALLGRLDLALCLIAAAQIFWAFFRFAERASQINKGSERLLRPLRK